ncbi:hypothetical protein B296_00054800 [Ensete ventricosum]|uniref:Uncharacterized protein n=1 Tax=Ensete ventricosum TaxID=4639 RepID=A0A426X6F7_ENSVE|nr:hypothetical protein B296_00054800 [Ensete ventricosum]
MKTIAAAFPQADSSTFLVFPFPLNLVVAGSSFVLPCTTNLTHREHSDMVPLPKYEVLLAQLLKFVARDRVGTSGLFKVLLAFAIRDIGLTKIESRQRPIRMEDEAGGGVAGTAKHFEYALRNRGRRTPSPTYRSSLPSFASSVAIPCVGQIAQIQSIMSFSETHSSKPHLY